MSDAYPSEIEKLAPATGRQGAPESGTYGVGAELDALAAGMPGGEGAAPVDQPLPEIGAMPQGAPPSGPGGLPAGIMGPSTHPEQPISTPLSMPEQMGGSATEQRIQWLHAVARSPQADDELREWAQTVLDVLIRED